jgi:hypothetical protein
MSDPWRLASAVLSGRCDRRYVDAEGVAWCVHEREAAGREPALYFETNGLFRRVTDYPAGWRDLPTGDLEALSHKT